MIFYFLHIFFLFLVLFVYILKDELPFRYLLALVLIIGFNPFFYSFKNNVVSDLTFLFMVYLNFSVIHAIYQKDHPQRSLIKYGLLLGAIMYLPYGTRSIGIIIPISLIIFDFIKSRRLTKCTAIAVLVFLIAKETF